MNTVIYDYKGSQISFSNEKNVMVNLTEVAKAFPEKNLTQIINSQEIKDYCDALTKLQNYSLADLLEVRKGAPHYVDYEVLRKNAENQMKAQTPKIIAKLFGRLKKCVQFCSAFHFNTGGLARQYTAGIFYVLLKRYKTPTPVWCVNAPTACIRWNATGKRGLSFLLTYCNIDCFI